MQQVESRLFLVHRYHLHLKIDFLLCTKASNGNQWILAQHKFNSGVSLICFTRGTIELVALLTARIHRNYTSLFVLARYIRLCNN